jgi:type II secretory pathway component PulF
MDDSQQKPTLGLSADDLTILNEEIAAMARAGLPLDQGLAHLASEMGRGKLQRITDRLASDLQEGKTLPQALADQGGSLPPYYASLVAAGIRSGRLGEVLATLTNYARTISDLRTAAVNALIYPALILTLAMGLCIFYVTWVAPQFAKIFADFRMRLPVVTETVFAIVNQPYLALVTPAIVIFTGFVAAWLILRTTERGRMAWTRFVYAVPVVGSLLRSARLAAFTDLLAILVDHNVPLPEAFRLAGEASSDPILRAGSGAVARDLQQGTPLPQALKGHRMVPEFIGWMTSVGERHGRLGSTLHHAAELYRRQAEMRTALFRSVFPPFIVLMVAIVVLGLFLVAMAMPLLSLLEGLSGGK